MSDDGPSNSTFGRSVIEAAGAAVKERFESERRVLSFDEYLALVAEEPARHCRDASRYLLDAIEHYGEYPVERPWAKRTRYALFDLPFASSEGRRNDRLVGQEALQHQVVDALGAFAREGRVNRLVLLHGPNGSAKSTFAACLAAGLEHYSSVPEGAVYRFSWVFPRGENGGGIGFSSERAAIDGIASFAHLPEERIDAKLSSELREHPLLLIPQSERQALLTKLGMDSPPDILWSGDLSHKNRQIFDALLVAYRGDLSRVLSHVQIERYYLSRRYRVGTVTIGPEMAVDARERQVTADRSLGSLPASLSATSLYETFGELADGNGGLIEYSDLLKRPLDAWKYLLIAIETGEVALQFSNLQLNSVLLASSNEMHLKAFQEHPEYNSFRGRLRLVRVAYLRDYNQEQGIYDAQIVPQVKGHVAPYATYVAALWAVLTRLRRAEAERFEDAEVGKLAASLSSLEKADLYARGEAPRRFGSDDRKLLEREIPSVYDEQSASMDYEGLYGASPREMRGILHAASTGRLLSPLSVLEELEVFCRRDDYAFLRRDPDGDYYDPRAAVALVRERWLDLVDDALQSATGIIEEAQYLSLFDLYVTHVSHRLRGEQVPNAITGESEDPDSKMMKRVETILGAEDTERFRQDLLSQVATWALDHPGAPVDYALLFPGYIEELAASYFREQKERIAGVARDVLRHLGAGEGQVQEPELALTTLGALKEREGYEDESLREALSALLDARYS
ncbi:MAG: serine protein kinase PrkA [Polyangiales bacterium]